MSGIYISGLEMPKRGEFSHVRIYDNGEVTIESNGVEYPVAKAVAVTDYGEQKHGKWVWSEEHDGAICSECKTHKGGRLTLFCPNCGARMDPELRK